MKAMIDFDLSDSREVYIFYREEGVDDQENIRRIMENSCIWESLEPLNFPWTLFSRELVNNPSTLSPKIESLEILKGVPSFNKYTYLVSYFDKGVLNNSRKAFL